MTALTDLQAAAALLSNAEAAAATAADAELTTFVTAIRAIQATLPSAGFPSALVSFLQKTADNAEASRANELKTIASYYTPATPVSPPGAP